MQQCNSCKITKKRKKLYLEEEGEKGEERGGKVREREGETREKRTERGEGRRPKRRVEEGEKKRLGLYIKNPTRCQHKGALGAPLRCVRGTCAPHAGVHRCQEGALAIDT